MIGWIDARAGVSGDMILGALVDCGVPLAAIQKTVDALGLGIVLAASTCKRGGIGATKVDVHYDDSVTARHLPEILALLQPLAPAIRSKATAVFQRLAQAEAEVHRIEVNKVHFHEVGALDTLADVVGAVAGFAELGVRRLHCSPVSLGFGTTRGAHGPLPVPAPAVLQLLRGIPVTAGPVPMECATPTGAAILAILVHEWTELPAMAITKIGCGAGQRDPEQIANVLRLILGTSVVLDAPDGHHSSQPVLLEANVDDLDPRLWPWVIDRLLEAGAHDAWLTPILMKKGRPAHTLTVLCSASSVREMTAVVFRETTTIGMRQMPISAKHGLERSEHTVEVDGQQIRIKTAWLAGEEVNSNPEWRDVAAAAEILKRPAKEVLAEARRAATAD